MIIIFVRIYLLSCVKLCFYRPNRITDSSQKVRAYIRDGGKHAQLQSKLQPYMNRRTKKGPCGFWVCSSLNAHAQSPVWATDLHFCLKLTQGPLLHVCKQQRHWQDCASAGRLCDKHHFLMCWHIFLIMHFTGRLLLS